MKRVGQIYREALAQEIRDNTQKKNSTFVVSYSGLSNQRINQLRRELQKSHASVAVSKNALARLVLKELSQEELAKNISRQTAFVWSDHDAAAISKILMKFSEDSENVSVQGGILEGRVLSLSDVKRLSDLPSKEVLLSMLLSAIQSPLTRFAGALNAKTRELLSVLKQLSEEKGGK